MKKVLGCLRKADEDFGMIQDGDRIAVGVSGGKDSILLLSALHRYSKFAVKKFELLAVTVDLGFGYFDAAPVQSLCERLQIPYTAIHTDIGKIVFEARQEDNPCALCAKLRKGAFYSKLKELGCNKAAFAHHADDVLETLCLSLLYENRINTFSPVTYMEDIQIALIRPFIYLGEKHIISVVKREGLPVIPNSCPACGKTKRAEIKELLKNLTRKYPKAKESMLSALKNTQTYHLWDNSYREPK